MAWTTPRTWVAGEVVTASIMNTHVRDNLIDLDDRADLTQQFVQEDISLTASGSLAPAADTTVITIDANGAYSVYGMSVPARSPWAIDIVSIYSGNTTLEHESGSEATPAKRFYLPASGSVVLSIGEGVRFLYISVPVGARWVSMIGS